MGGSQGVVPVFLPSPLIRNSAIETLIQALVEALIEGSVFKLKFVVLLKRELDFRVPKCNGNRGGVQMGAPQPGPPSPSPNVYF